MMAKIDTLITRLWAPITLLILISITVLSLIPLPELPLPGSDKTHHLLAYAALMCPAFLSIYKFRFWLTGFFLIWSGAIELLQPYVNRYCEFEDLLANGAGLLIGAVVGWALRGVARSYERSEL